MKEYHILSLSGGKDSTALAFFMKENMPEIFKKTELVFCDTECELPETYEYLNKIEIFLNKPITYLKPQVSFQHIYDTRKILPKPQNRWCTVELKTKTMQNFIKRLNYFVYGKKCSDLAYISVPELQKNTALQRLFKSFTSLSASNPLRSAQSS